MWTEVMFVVDSDGDIGYTESQQHYEGNGSINEQIIEQVDWDDGPVKAVVAYRQDEFVIVTRKEAKEKLGG